MTKTSKAIILVIVALFILGLEAQVVKEVRKLGPITIPAMEKAEKNDLYKERPKGRLAIKSVHFKVKDWETNEIVPSTVIYSHHVILSSRKNKDLVCGIPEVIGARGQEMPKGELPPNHFLISKSNDVWNLAYHMISYSNKDQKVYYEMVMEYIPLEENKKYPLYVPVKMALFMIGRGGDPCNPNYTIGKEDPNALVQVNTRSWNSPFEGEMVRCVGHLHKGGVDLFMKQNNELLCRSKPNYVKGNGGFIESMSACSLKRSIKKGDNFEVVSVYNNTYQENAMGIMLCFATITSKSSEDGNTHGEINEEIGEIRFSALSIFFIVFAGCVVGILFTLLGVYVHKKLNRQPKNIYSIQEDEEELAPLEDNL